MYIKFEDSYDGAMQDYACAILYSLNKAREATSRKGDAEGIIRDAINREAQFHYEEAIRTTLRIQGVVTHTDAFVTAENIAYIAEQQENGFEDFMKKNSDKLFLVDEE